MKKKGSQTPKKGRVEVVCVKRSFLHKRVEAIEYILRLSHQRLSPGLDLIVSFYLVELEEDLGHDDFAQFFVFHVASLGVAWGSVKEAVALGFEFVVENGGELVEFVHGGLRSLGLGLVRLAGGIGARGVGSIAGVSVVEIVGTVCPSGIGGCSIVVTILGLINWLLCRRVISFCMLLALSATMARSFLLSSSC